MTSHSTARARATLRTTGLATALLVACGLGGSTLAGAAAPASVTPAPTVEATSVIGLREGATGDGVRAVQEKLLGFGYVIRGGATGVFGPSTTRVLRSFQEQNGLNPTGVVTENTAKYLGLTGAAAGGSSPQSNNSTSGGTQATVGTSPPASTATSYVGLARGATGEAVRQLQLKLLGLQLYLGGGADGVFGASTETAVRMVQRVNGLPETGVVTARVASLLGLTGSASSPATSAPAGSLLQYGSRGEAVKRIQELLIKAGLEVPGGADGIFGLNTQRAVRQFQQAHGLSITGQVDAATDAALAQAAANGGSPAAPNPGSGSSPNGYVGLRLGSTGAAVKRIQQAIISTGLYLRGGADGIFGNATYNALVRYQTANGLTASGVVDAATVGAMGLGSGSGGSTGGFTGGGSTAAGYAVYDEHGDRVKALQRALLAAGIAVPGGADGVFGSGTLGAVRSFQQAKGLVATGKVDQGTAQALGLSPMEVAATPAVTAVGLQASPIGGNCWYGDTWQASRGAGRTHLGVDIGAAEGTPIRAVVSGRISYIYSDQPGSLSGNALKIALADGTYYFYGHLQGFAEGIGVGTTVAAGQVIGYVGKTGNAGIPHLHLEVHPGGGSAVNPYPYVKAVGCS